MKDKRSFGNIRKLPSGRFQARYTGPDGSYITAPKTFGARVHAEAWLGDRLREVDAGLWNPIVAVARKRKRVTFKEYAEEWLETRQVAGRPIKARTRARRTTTMAKRETTDPASPLWQADVLGTGLGPNDSSIDDDAMGPVNVQLPTPDYSQTDPMVDGVQAFDSSIPSPPPGSMANHVHISDPDGNTLSGHYSILGDN